MNSLARRGREIWQRLWFKPDAARNLAAMRIIVAVHALWILLSRDLPSVSGLEDFWIGVPASRQWRYLLFPGHPGLEAVLYWACVAALIAAAAGIRPRIACFVAGVLLYHLAPLEVIIQTGSPLARGLTFAPLFLLILAFSRSGDALVLEKGKPSTGPGSAYAWPRRLMWFLICQMYFFSAYAKVVRTGWAWASIDNMRAWFLIFGVGLTSETTPVRPLAFWLAHRPGLLAIIGAGTLTFEFAFITAFFSRGARRILVPAAVLFHLGIALVSGVHIGETWMLLLFVNYEWLWRHVGGRGSRAATSYAVPLDTKPKESPEAGGGPGVP